MIFFVLFCLVSVREYKHKPKQNLRGFVNKPTRQHLKEGRCGAVDKSMKKGYKKGRQNVKDHGKRGGMKKNVKDLVGEQSKMGAVKWGRDVTLFFF